MPKPYPREFRDDVVRVARRRDPGVTLEQIAASIQGYDPKALPIPAAQAFIARLVQPVTQTERVPILGALGRVLARDVVSPFDVPPHDNSAMDGFAFRGAELSTADAVSGEMRLRIAGTGLAGQPYAGDVPPGVELGSLGVPLSSYSTMSCSTTARCSTSAACGPAPSGAR